MVRAIRSRPQLIPWRTFLTTQNQSHGRFLLWLFIKGDFQDEMILPWLRAQLQIPSTLWLQPSKKTDKKTPKRTSRIALANFYGGNWGRTKRTIQKRSNRKLHVCILRLILSSKSTDLRGAMGELAAATHFWAMQSCKYSKVLKARQKQTKQLCHQNIVFIQNGNIIPQKSTEST